MSRTSLQNLRERCISTNILFTRSAVRASNAVSRQSSHQLHTSFVFPKKIETNERAADDVKRLFLRLLQASVTSDRNYSESERVSDSFREIRQRHVSLHKRSPVSDASILKRAIVKSDLSVPFASNLHYNDAPHYIGTSINVICVKKVSSVMSMISWYPSMSGSFRATI